MKVWGEAVFDGKPIESGTITLLPIPGNVGTATGADILNGKYEIPAKDGPLAGQTYKVEIKAQRKVGTMPHPFNPSTIVDRMEDFIPTEYNAQSKLSAVISDKASDNKHDFRLDRK